MWEESAPVLRFVGPRDAPRAESDHAEGVLRKLGQRPRLDVVSAWRLLAFAEYDVRRSFFDDVWQVPVGCAVVAAEDGHLRVETPVLRPAAGWTRESAAAECRRLIESAVESAVKPARRVAVLLSGGLDSGVVAAVLCGVWKSLGRDPADLAAFHSAPPPGEGPGEVPQAEVIARHLGLALHLWTPPTLADPFAGCDDMLRRNDVPSDDGNFAPTRARLSAVRDAGFDTVLTGDGGDEVFGGWWVRPWRRASLLRTGLALAELGARAIARPVRNAILGRRGALERKARVFDTPTWLLARAPADTEAVGYAPPPIGLRGARSERWGRTYAARQMTVLSWWRAWGECLGLSIRCPLLARPLAGFAASLDPRLFQSSTDRVLLRRAAVRDLPAPALQWPKRVPGLEHLQRTLRAHGREWLEAHVGGSALERSGLTPREEWSGVVDRGATGSPAETFRALALPSLGAWCRAWGL